MMQIDFPYSIDGIGRTASTAQDDHIRDMIEQLLFTAPGERVNRPDFGCGLLQLVFEPNSEMLAAAIRHTTQSALQRWLGDLIQVEMVEVESQEATLQVTLQYTIRRSQQRQQATFRWGGLGG